MRLLDRYLMRELLVPLGYCLGGFLLFWTSFDLLAEMDQFRRQGLLFRDVVEYYGVKTPELLVTILPVAFLLSLLYSLTNHARHQELTAMRAAGQSMWRLSLPYLGVGMVLSGTLFLLNEFAVPDGNDAAQRILNRRVGGPGVGENARWYRNLSFRNEPGLRIWTIGAFHLDTGAMVAPNVDWQKPDGSRLRLSADRADFTNGVWVFQGVRTLHYAPVAPEGGPRPVERGETNQVVFPELSETPAQIKSEIRYSELSSFTMAKRARLSLQEILDYQTLHPHLASHDRARLQTQFYGRLAEPLTCLVVVFIALPFGAPSGRRNVFVGVASSIFIGFAYFVMMRFSLALGTGGYLLPWVAALLPNAVFAAAGVFLTNRIR